MSRQPYVLMLSNDAQKTALIKSQLDANGLNFKGSLFKDDLEKNAWNFSLDEIKNPETGVLIICGSKTDFFKKSILKGLSLLILSVQYLKGEKFPIIVVSDFETEKQNLPFALKNVFFVSITSPLIGAKAAAKANISVKKGERNFRLNILTFQNNYIWIEAGPLIKKWNGIITGVLKPSKIDALGIGEKDKIPEKSVLEYPLRGIELEINKREFYAWAAKNQISDNESAFFRIDKNSDSFIFGSFNDGKDIEVCIVDLV
ncbi:MAG: hypothetical protein RBR08_06815 [Desulforegulaceae bacterium]|jgi:hypothetical protein|nr:hypothetical protein [Desulforegulaceae bacterium]